MSNNIEPLAQEVNSRFNEVLEDPAVKELIELNQSFGISPEHTVARLSGIYHGAKPTETDQKLDPLIL